MEPHMWTISSNFSVITIMACMFNKIVGCSRSTKPFHFLVPQWHFIIIIAAQQ